MISVLLPSRGRVKALTDTVEGLLGLADRPGSIEILIAADPDDPDTHTGDLPWQASVWTAPERYGYPRLHEYINRLAEQADGGWLMLWNDDARMRTAGWDRLVEERAPSVLWPHSNDIATCNTFPIWPKTWTDSLGHVSLSPHCDSWIQYLGQTLGQHERVAIEILHDRADLTGGHDDQTRAESLAGYRTADYGSPAMEAARADDVTALKQFLNIA